jgi:hypothetical protein
MERKLSEFERKGVGGRRQNRSLIRQVKPWPGKPWRINFEAVNCC